MNRLLHLILFFSLAVTSMAWRQTPAKFDKDAYEKEQHKFVTRGAKLTHKEARTFFAIYDEMRAKERQLFKQKNQFRKQRPTTDEECRKAIIERDKIDISRKQLQYKYHMRMLKVLPAKKVMEALHQAEAFDKMKFRQMNRNKDRGRGKQKTHTAE